MPIVPFVARSKMYALSSTICLLALTISTIPSDVNGDCDFPSMKRIQNSYWLSEKNSCGSGPGWDLNEEELAGSLHNSAANALENVEEAFNLMKANMENTQRCVCQIRDDVWDFTKEGKPKFTKAAAKVFELLDLSQDCIDEMYRVSTETRKDPTEGMRMIRAGKIPAQLFGGDPKLFAKEDRTKTEKKSKKGKLDDDKLSDINIVALSKAQGLCPDPRTSAPPFDINQHKSLGINTRQDFVDKILTQKEGNTMPGVKFRQMFREAGLRPTGNIPKGCVYGNIVGSGVMPDMIRATSAEQWNGKCFFSAENNTLYNIIISDKGPNVLVINGKFTEYEGASFLDGKPSIRLTYGKSDYWTGFQNLFTNNGIMVDYYNFVDELREHPDVPGMFLGLMWMAPRDTIPTQSLQRLFADYLRISTNIGDVRFSDSDDGVIFSSPAQGDGADNPNMYGIPVTSFVLFQTQEGYEQDCLTECPDNPK